MSGSNLDGNAFFGGGLSVVVETHPSGNVTLARTGRVSDRVTVSQPEGDEVQRETIDGLTEAGVKAAFDGLDQLYVRGADRTRANLLELLSFGTIGSHSIVVGTHPGGNVTLTRTGQVSGRVTVSQPEMDGVTQETIDGLTDAEVRAAFAATDELYREWGMHPTAAALRHHLHHLRDTGGLSAS